MAIAQALREAHAIGVIFVGWNGHTTLGPVGRVFMQHAGGFALGIQNEMAVFRIRRAAHEANHLTGLGIHAGIVAIAGDDIAGPVGNGLIKHMAVEIVVGEYSGVPAHAVHP